MRHDDDDDGDGNGDDDDRRRQRRRRRRRRRQQRRRKRRRDNDDAEKTKKTVRKRSETFRKRSKTVRKRPENGPKTTLNAPGTIRSDLKRRQNGLIEPARTMQGARLVAQDERACKLVKHHLTISGSHLNHDILQTLRRCLITYVHLQMNNY